jgi:XTP/dITP diphosphohydrolase
MATVKKLPGYNLNKPNYSIVIYRSQFIMNNIININENTKGTLLLATTNAGKLRELRALLKDCPIQTLSPADIGLELEVPETGSTYDENAILKAQAYHQASGLAVLADDTGLEVDALGGAPGLHSARFSSKPGATDADRRAKLITALSQYPRPWTARFHCAVAVAAPHCPVKVFWGTVEGEIITRESGEHGFGYDRLFWISEAGMTLADLDMEQKNRFSHRALAIDRAIPFLLENLK